MYDSQLIYLTVLKSVKGTLNYVWGKGNGEMGALDILREQSIMQAERRK